VCVCAPSAGFLVGCTSQLGRLQLLLRVPPNGQRSVASRVSSTPPAACILGEHARVCRPPFYPRRLHLQLGLVASRNVRRPPSESPTGNTRSVCSIRQLLTCTVYVPGVRVLVRRSPCLQAACAARMRSSARDTVPYQGPASKLPPCRSECPTPCACPPASQWPLDR